MDCCEGDFITSVFSVPFVCRICSFVCFVCIGTSMDMLSVCALCGVFVHPEPDDEAAP